MSWLGGASESSRPEFSGLGCGRTLGVRRGISHAPFRSGARHAAKRMARARARAREVLTQDPDRPLKPGDLDPALHEVLSIASEEVDRAVEQARIAPRRRILGAVPASPALRLPMSA